LTFSLIRLLENTISPGLLIINPRATTILAIIILFLLILSFVVSGSEVAFFSLTYKDINILKTKQDASWKRIVSLLEEPKSLLASMFIAGSAINIAIVILANFLIDAMVINIGFWGAFILKVVLVCFVIILFSEVMPKIWASQNNLQFAYYTSGIIELVHLLFSRVSGWAVSRSEGLEKFFGRKQKGEQLRYQIDQSVKNQSSEEEKNLLNGIAKFGSITVRQVMRARLDVFRPERESGRDLGHRERLSERQWLRRGQLARDRAAVAFRDRDRDQARLLLERHRHGLDTDSTERAQLSGRRQHEGRAHVRVARKRDLLGRREDAHTARVPGFGRKHERALGEVELARNLLHAPAGEAPCVGKDGERISAKQEAFQ